MSPDKRMTLVGCPLDSDENQESVEQKLAQAGAAAGRDDPYLQVCELLRDELEAGRLHQAGCLEVPDWLRPVPPAAEAPRLTVDNFVRFIDEDGCRLCAQALGQMVREKVLPGVPVLVGVDHSLTGGVYRELARELGPENLSLVVLDSHLDALPLPILAGAVAYDMETNPQSLYDPADPFLRQRPDSYNASSFLHHLLEEGVLDPRHLCLVGISDYPPRHSFRIDDPRIRAYTGLYSGLKKRGAGMVTKADLAKGPGKLKVLLNKLRTPYVYVSVDMDLGALDAVQGVRFRNRRGLSRPQFQKVIRTLAQFLAQGPELAGLDLCEFNPRIPDPEVYALAAEVIRRLCLSGPRG